MNFEVTDIAPLAANLNIAYTEEKDAFSFRIQKEDHAFKVKVLKDGQYIFISLIVGKSEFPIEHLEFYMKETKSEILQELKEILVQLKQHKTRWLSLNNKKRQVEINKNDEWKPLGYPGRKIRQDT